MTTPGSDARAPRTFNRRNVLRLAFTAVPIGVGVLAFPRLGGTAAAGTTPTINIIDAVSQSIGTTFVLGTTKPDASTTGVPAGTSLVDVTGAFTASVAGAVITNKRFRNYVYVRAANVTFRNCEFRGPASGAFVTYGLVDCRSSAATNVLIDRCTFAATATNMYWCNGVSVRSGASVTVNRCNISAVADGLNVSGASLTATGNYIHDLYFFNNSVDHASDAYHPYWEHNDGIQISGGAGPYMIRGNYFSSYVQLGTNDGIHGIPAIDPATGSWNRRWGAGITASPDSGQITNATITQNWFEGGTASFQSSSSGEVGANFGTISSNRFGMDQYNYGSSSRYQIRYKSGITIAGLGTNLFDPSCASVPSSMKDQTFTVSFTGGIRID
ncbi:hypothetical protein SAMN04515671_0515 [Nakamurella panacisegetis]|uniref:Right handed beta helix region n=1 Tax=Nakamurella panacisegetis TaxID=1090615 RepID=A0A1H0IJ43_9ACTN|nr:hypothetical protein [Nakamurella panacisegetis]SDO31061.1 hypothetical protein SAMN04515671_0515 [Nakamurella panacisegetis]